MATSISYEFPKYTGKIQPKPGETYESKLIYPYLPNDQLINAVNLAIYLNRPLLLRGEPGSGKTQLALAVAYELNLKFYAWYIKSTSRAKDGLYTYDTVGRLRDAQLAASGVLSHKNKNHFEDPNSYIRLGPLGKAFKGNERAVVLIDEIDKADIDFPNDLLLELDELRFIIEETGEEVNTKLPPIVIITSNDEKALSDAFLRRCLFYYISFPSYEQLVKIVKYRFPEIANELVQKAASRFVWLREKMGEETGRFGKNVSTSELLDWIQVLKRDSLDKALNSLEGKHLPYLEVLLKSLEAHVSYLRLSEDNE